MITVWYTNGAVQEYNTLEEAGSEIAEIIEKDSYPFALIQDSDGNRYQHKVNVRLEKCGESALGSRAKK